MAENSRGALVSDLLSVGGVVGLIASATLFPIYAPGRQWEMGIAALCSLAIVAIANIDRLSHFKAGDYEVHLREAQRAVTQAQVSAEQVRTLAAMLARTTLEGLARIGIYGFLPDTEKWALKRQLDEALVALGLSEEQVEGVGRSFEGMMRLRHVAQIRKAAAELVPEENDERSQFLKELRGLLGARQVDPHPPAAIRAFIERRGLISEAVEEALQDYEYYVEHGRHRRPQAWERE